MDYGGVLANAHLDAAEHVLASRFGVTQSALRAVLTEKSATGRMIREDRLSEDEFWKQVAGELGATVGKAPASDLSRLWAQTYSVRSEIVELIRKHEGTLHFGIATNVDRFRGAHLVKAVDGVIDRTLIFTSWEARACKPADGFFDYIETKLSPSSLDALLFVDDRSEHVGAAASRGWKTHQFQDVPTLNEAFMAHAASLKEK